MKCLLDESQDGIKVAGRNSNNLRYAHDTNFMTESKEELKSLLIKVNKENKKVGLKINIQKTKITASCPITLWQIHTHTQKGRLKGTLSNKLTCGQLELNPTGRQGCHEDHTAIGNSMEWS